jgi:hypothetical protein
VTSYTQLTNLPTLVTSYTQLQNLPTLVTSYTQLSNLPILFDGNYNSLSNKLTAGSNIAIDTNNAISVSGTFNVSQGGTGAGTFTSGQLLIGNGTSAFFNTALNTSTNLTTTSTHLSIYVRNNSNAGAPYDLANATNAGMTIDPTFLIARYSSSLAYIGIADSSYGTNTASLDSRGFWSGGTNGSRGQTINYYAAPNQSLDAEQALLQAVKRARVITGW